MGGCGQGEGKDAMFQAKDPGPRAAGRDEAEMEGWLEASAVAPARHAQGVTQAPILRHVEALLLPSMTIFMFELGCEFSFPPPGPCKLYSQSCWGGSRSPSYLPRSPPCHLHVFSGDGQMIAAFMGVT